MSEAQKTVAAPVIEQSTPSPTTTPEPTLPSKEDNERWAHLARKEKSLRAEATRLQAMKAELEKQKSVPQSPDWKERLKSDPLSMFAEAGLSQDELVQLALNAKPEDISIRQLKAEIAALKAETNGIKTSAQQTQEQALAATLKQITHYVSNLVDGNEAYELIKATDSVQDVVDHIKKTYDDEGVILDYEDAAKHIEDKLYAEALAIAKLKKVQTGLVPPPPPEPSPEEKQIQTQKQHSSTPRITTTLTNRLETSSPSKPLSSKDRRERAIKAFLGQLK